MIDHRCTNLFLPLGVISLNQLIGNKVRQRLVDLSPGQDLAHLANGHTPRNPAEDAADCTDIARAIEPVTTLGAGRLDQTITSLPGTQGHRIHAGQTCDITDGHQIHLSGCAIFDRQFGKLNDFRHGRKNSAAVWILF